MVEQLAFNQLVAGSNPARPTTFPFEINYLPGTDAQGAVILRSLYPLRMTAHKLVATDTIHAIPVSLIAGFSYLLLGFVDLTLLGYLIAGSIPAALLGSKLMNQGIGQINGLLRVDFLTDTAD